MKRLLKEYIGFILEAAIDSNQAASKNLALFQTNNKGNTVHILYNLNLLKPESNPVIGMIRTDEPNQ